MTNSRYTSWTLTRHLPPAPPTGDGWQHHNPTGTRRFHCPRCGTDTGTVPIATAAAETRRHT